MFGCLHKIPHSGGCDKTQRHCLYKGIASQVLSPQGKRKLGIHSYAVFQDVVRRVHAISYIILMRFLKLFRAFL